MSGKLGRLLLALLALRCASCAPVDEETEASTDPSTVPVQTDRVLLSQSTSNPDAKTTGASPSETPSTSGCGIVCKEPFPVPVCGSNGRVYDSECVMKQMTCGSKVRVVDWERCRGQHPLCPDKCLDIYDPVCGKDGTFYPNLCIMQRRNCGKRVGTQALSICIAKVRESRRLDACPVSCTEIYEPVCGSNGEVYLNECVLKQENCGRSVNLVPLSRCIKAPKCPKRCLPIMDPVCGSDGQRYLNHCRMQELNCGKNLAVMPKTFCT